MEASHDGPDFDGPGTLDMTRGEQAGLVVLALLTVVVSAALVAFVVIVALLQPLKPQTPPTLVGTVAAPPEYSAASNADPRCGAAPKVWKADGTVSFARAHAKAVNADVTDVVNCTPPALTDNCWAFMCQVETRTNGTRFGHFEMTHDEILRFELAD